MGSSGPRAGGPTPRWSFTPAQKLERQSAGAGWTIGSTIALAALGGAGAELNLGVAVNNAALQVGLWIGIATAGHVLYMLLIGARPYSKTRVGRLWIVGLMLSSTILAGTSFFLPGWWSVGLSGHGWCVLGSCCHSGEHQGHDGGAECFESVFCTGGEFMGCRVVVGVFHGSGTQQKDDEDYGCCGEDCC